MNFFDSDRLVDVLIKNGHEMSESLDGEVDLLLVNTCAVREKPEKRAISFMERFRNRAKFFGFGGCVAQKLGSKLFSRLPFVNFIFGSYTIEKIPEILRRLEKGESGPFDLTGFEGNCFPNEPVFPYHSKGLKSFVKIMEGCNNFCSYCIVPYVRGREIYRPASHIVKEVQRLVEMGVKEIMLIGQNVNSYRDPDTNIGFVKLLEMINSVSGNFWIRYTTSNPKDFGMDMVQAHRDLEKLCNHVHLPFQSGSNKVLKLMKRRYTREEYLEKIERLKDQVPDIAITSDVIVGFPGETQQDFEQTLDLVKTVRFDLLYSFVFSRREGTEAYLMEDNVPLSEKLERLKVLQDIQRSISIEKNREEEGKVLKVLVEGISKKDKSELSGRTSKNKVVNFRGSDRIIGEFVRVKILEGYTNSLKGVLDNDKEDGGCRGNS